MLTYQIHLIRHGQTEGNRKGQYIGSTDCLLSEPGKEELRRLREARPYPEAEVYYTSPLLRCVQSMHLLYPGVDCLEVPGLREMDFGQWEGKTAEGLAGDPLFAQWLEGADVAPPGGESSRQFSQRVCATFEFLVEGMLRSGTRSAVVMAHGGVIMTILAAYGLPRAKFYDWLVENGHGYSMRIMPNLWMSGRVGEVYATIPDHDSSSEEEERRWIIDLGREAADRAYRNQEETD